MYITEYNTELVTNYRREIVLHAGTDPEGIGGICSPILLKTVFFFISYFTVKLLKYE